MTAAADQIVREFGEAVAAHDLARLAELLDDNLSYEMCAIDLPGAGTFDKPTMLARFGEVLERFEHDSPRMTITRVFHDGDWVIAEGVGAGRFRNGLDYDNRYIILYEILDGRVRTVREYMDTQHAATLFAAAAGAPADD
jgi:uncharacterized protein